MKITYHVPVEQFGFVSLEEERTQIEFEGVAHVYRSISEAFKQKPGNEMPSKRFNEILDEYLETGKMVNGGDFYEELSPNQKMVINEIKKSKKRTED